MEVENMSTSLQYVIVILTVVSVCVSRKHELNLTDDTRKVVDVSTFGFFKNGLLAVNVSALVVKDPKHENQSIGFTLDKSISDGGASYLEEHAETQCILTNTKDVSENDSISNVTFTFNFTGLTLNVKRIGWSLKQLHIFEVSDEQPDCSKDMKGDYANGRRRDTATGQKQVTNQKQDSQPGQLYNETQPSVNQSSQDIHVPLLKYIPIQGDRNVFNASFYVCIKTDYEEGLYNLFFHNCNKSKLSLIISVVEMNAGGNYLSAGDIPLPTLFILVSFVYFASACYWFIYLRQHKEDVFKIHYLMFLLGVLKTLSLMFHAMDYHFISADGSPMEAFAILFYITYLIKGALLFLNIALIGSGWAFVKPILSEKDKKLFIFVIPLQVFANVAYIITDTSEEGESEYATWKTVFVLVDILCCVAILYPVIWSIRHLQEAATTDGKAAISLSKLKLFRHFYILVVCYIYFTRIIVFLVKIIVPFRYMWLDEFFFELATYSFFVITAYNFRPGSDNPYFQVPSDDEDEVEMEEVLTENGMTEGLMKVHTTNTSTTKAVQREGNHTSA
ncbi:protein GPR107-like isoform X2 [Acanthaster planci]|uniref:Protein GPR107-like isoform X2 n=1 Tax=Acanthaster planci TaxID=133434 RepID=A0A8B7XZ32_ACAPL|nr:protein GPR107-like isoform X2 [Acanthaster planci]